MNIFFLVFMYNPRSGYSYIQKYEPWSINKSRGLYVTPRPRFGQPLSTKSEVIIRTNYLFYLFTLTFSLYSWEVADKKNEDVISRTLKTSSFEKYNTNKL